MKLHKFSSFLLVSTLIHQVACEDYEEIAKLVDKNSKSIKSLKNSNKKLMKENKNLVKETKNLVKENKDLKTRLDVLDDFVTGQQSVFITSIDKKVDQLLAFWNFDIEFSQLADNPLLLSIKNWLTSHSNSFTEFWTWRDDVDNDIEEFDQKQDGFISNLGVIQSQVNANTEGQQTLNIDVSKLENSYVVLQDRMEVDNKNVDTRFNDVADKTDNFDKALSNVTREITDLKNDQGNTTAYVLQNSIQILEISTKHSKFENDLQGLEYDIKGLRNEQNSTSASILKNSNQIIAMVNKDQSFELELKNLLDDVSDMGDAQSLTNMIVLHAVCLGGTWFF